MTEMMPTDKPELWQLYREDGRPLPARGATKNDTFRQGLLHAAAHVWIWRASGGNTEVLLQKRAAHKRTWPGLYDISAAGHVDLGESPLQAAVRETSEEIGWQIDADRLQSIGVYRWQTRVGDDVENEFQHLYLLQAGGDDFSLQATEVESVSWMSLQTLAAETATDSPLTYVPHGQGYYRIICDAIRRAANST